MATYNVDLSDLGKPVRIDGKEGYILQAIEHFGGNDTLRARVIEPKYGCMSTYDLSDLTKG